MKKITLLLFFMLSFGSVNYGQCLFTTKAPSSTIVANNSGAIQSISTFAFAKNYAQLSNLIVGGKYTFNCNANAVGKYVTITDLADNVIGFGVSPLIIENVTSANIKVHYYETVDCGTNWNTLTLTFQYILPTCPSSTNIAVTNLTTNGASFIWTAGSGVTAWEVLVMESDALAPTSAISGTTVNTIPEYSVSNLDPATSYKLYVRSICATEFGVWGTPLNFTTMCQSATSINENFDTTAVTNLPNCWSSIIRGTTINANSYIGVENFDSHSGTNAMQIFKFTSSEDSDFILISPNLSNVSAGTHRLKFYARYNGAATIEVGTLNNNTNTALFTSFQELGLSGTYSEYEVDFATYSGTDTYIGIRISSGTSVFIDDVRWEQNPMCDDVANVMVNSTTPNSATISWELITDGSQWDIVYGGVLENDPNNLTPISPAPVTNPISTISGLTANTTYNVWVRSVCSDQNGAWIGPVAFTTDCIAIENFNENFDTVTSPELPTCWGSILSGETVSSSATVTTVNYGAYSGANTVLLHNQNSGTNDNVILVSPNLSTLSLASYQLRFYARTSSGSGTIEVGTLNNNTANSNFTVLEPINLTNTYSEYTIEFTNYSGTDTYIGWRNASSAYTDVFIDAVRWEAIPLCTDVSGINVSEITTTTATISWINLGSEVSYQVVCGASSITDPNTLTPSSLLVNSNFTVSGLNADASYNVWVRSVCSSGNGNWIGPISFDAQCSAISTFSENFDTTTNQLVPSCWTSVLYGPTLDATAYAYAVNYNGYSGSNSFRMNNYTSGPANTIMLISPNLNTLTPGTAYSLKFYGRSDSGSATVQIGTTSGSSSDAVFAAFQQIVLTSTYQEYTVNFSSYTGTNTYIALKNACLTSYAPVNLDNIRWEINLGVKDFAESNFNLYPNPSNHDITVNLINPSENMESITLYDMIGKIVFKKSEINSNQMKIDVSSLAKAVYLVEIYTTNKARTIKKLVVE